jgi:hypothetical protein
LSLFFMNYNCILTNSIIITFNIHIQDNTTMKNIYEFSCCAYWTESKHK